VLVRSLFALSSLRDSASDVWAGAAGGAKESMDTGEQDQQPLVPSLKRKLSCVDSGLERLEGLVTGPVSLPTTQLLANLDSDSSIQSFSLYSQLAKDYRWLERSHEYAHAAAAYLSQNSLKRGHSGAVTKSRRRNNNSSHTADPRLLNTMIDQVNKMFTDMKLTISRPGGTKLNAIVEVGLERILKAVLIFKGLMIEWVVVKGYEEELVKQDTGQPDIWGESRYEVFQRITENANAAMLYFQSPVYPELAVKSFMTYLHSFGSLFSDKCRGCHQHLQDNLPPTWREFRTLEAFHQDCRPS